MLVVTRKKSERIRVGEAIITLVTAENGKARIGIEAPRDMNIVREELIDGGFGDRKKRSRSDTKKSAGIVTAACGPEPQIHACSAVDTGEREAL